MKSLNFAFTGTSFLSVTSFLLMMALSLFSKIVSLLLFCLISWALDKSFSKFPYLFINSAAVFTPIPGTPGTLSLVSPARAWTSITLSDLTPNFFITSSSPRNLFFIGS